MSGVASRSSLGDGESFCKAAEYIARQPARPDGSPTPATLAGARQLLSYLVGRSTSQLNWSNDHFARVAGEAWAPAQDWSGRPLPPDSSLRLVVETQRGSGSAGAPAPQPAEDQEQRDAPADENDSESDSDSAEEEAAEVLTVQTIRKRVSLVYRNKNPSKQQEVSKLMKKYRGISLQFVQKGFLFWFPQFPSCEQRTNICRDRLGTHVTEIKE
jgi:hypothetical protein